MRPVSQCAPVSPTHIQCMSQPVTAYCRHIPLSEYLICTEYTYLSPCVGLGANISEISAYYYTPLSVEYKDSSNSYATIRPYWNETTLMLPTFLLRFEGKPCSQSHWHRKYITRGTGDWV